MLRTRAGAPARDVPQTELRNRRGRHRYRQKLIPRCRVKPPFSLAFSPPLDTKFESFRAHHVVRREQRFSGLPSNGAEVAGLRAAFGLCDWQIGIERPIWWLCLCWAKTRFPETETGPAGDLVRMRV